MIMSHAGAKVHLHVFRHPAHSTDRFYCTVFIGYKLYDIHTIQVEPTTFCTPYFFNEKEGADQPTPSASHKSPHVGLCAPHFAP